MSSASTRLRRIVAGIAAIGLVAALAACAPPKPDLTPSADDAEPVVTVRAYDNAYDPAEVTIEEGDAVRWVFEGSSEHDVVAEDESFVSDLMRDGSFTHVFETAGDFPYDCSIHPEMRGVVHVTEPAGQ